MQETPLSWLTTMANRWICSCFLFHLVIVKCLTQNPSSCESSGNATQCGTGAVCNNNLQCECQTGFFTSSGSATDCRSTSDPNPDCSAFSSECVYCGSSHEGPCMKCVHFVTSSGQCVGECEDGFHINVFPNSTFSARVCEGGNTSGSSSPLPQWAIIVIAVMAGLVILTGLVVLLVFSFTWFNRASSGQFDVEDTNTNLVVPTPSGTLRTKKSRSFEHIAPGDLDFSAQENPAYDDIDGEEENAEFMKKLAYLRTHAQVFLSMLNDMRRRLKELPPDAPTAQQYRNVMRDVTRLLYLLNKKPSAIEIPPDGIQLLTWSEQILQRYLASQGGSPRGRSSQSPNRLSALGDQAETHF